MLPELPSYQQQLHEQQTIENPNRSIPPDIKPQIDQQNFNNTPTEEKLTKDNECQDQKLILTDTMYPTKVEMDETTHPTVLGSENMQNPEQFLPVFNDNITGHFNSGEEIKIKKVILIKKPNHALSIYLMFFQSPTNIKQKINNTPPQKPSNKPLPDFNEAFGSTERGRFQSPPDPRLGPNKGYLEYFFDNNPIKYSDFHM